MGTQVHTKPFPRVAVGPKFMKGAESWPQRALPQFELVSYEEAFNREWDFDAHFVTYDVRRTGTMDPIEEFPRLRKVGRALEDLERAGYTVYQTMFALDYDNPGHEPWTAEEIVEFREKVDQAGQLDTLITSFITYYPTRHGARFVYVLKDPIPVGPSSEAMHKSLVRTWGQRGIAVDPGCSDWTRFFRLPKVMRE